MSLDLTPYLSMRGRGVHCWNVVERFYRDGLGITVTNYDAVLLGMATPDDFARIDEAWTHDIDVEWIRVDEPQPYDLIDIWAFKSHHVAIHIKPWKMMHKIGTYTRVEDYRGENWQRRIRGFYRHPLRA